jgi:adenylosuccinate synthase
VFEGAQGVLLDEWWGFHPYTTWSTTTFENIHEFLHADTELVRLGLIRAMPTRHGPGPFPTEDPDLKPLPTEHNKQNEWQGSWRTGWPDLVTLRYAIEVCGGVDMIGVTCLDQIPNDAKFCAHYESHELHVLPRGDLEAAERRTEELLEATPVYSDVGFAEFWDHVRELAPIGLQSYGPRAEDKLWTEYAHTKSRDSG